MIVSSKCITITQAIDKDGAKKIYNCLFLRKRFVSRNAQQFHFRVYIPSIVLVEYVM